MSVAFNFGLSDPQSRVLVPDIAYSVLVGLTVSGRTAGHLQQLSRHRPVLQRDNFFRSLASCQMTPSPGRLLDQESFSGVRPVGVDVDSDFYGTTAVRYENPERPDLLVNCYFLCLSSPCLLDLIN